MSDTKMKTAKMACIPDAPHINKHVINDNSRIILKEELMINYFIELYNSVKKNSDGTFMRYLMMSKKTLDIFITNFSYNW